MRPPRLTNEGSADDEADDFITNCRNLCWTNVCFRSRGAEALLTEFGIALIGIDRSLVVA